MTACVTLKVRCTFPWNSSAVRKFGSCDGRSVQSISQTSPT